MSPCYASVLGFFILIITQSSRHRNKIEIFSWLVKPVDMINGVPQAAAAWHFCALCCNESVLGGAMHLLRGTQRRGMHPPVQFISDVLALK